MNILERISLFYCVLFNSIANFNCFRMKNGIFQHSNTYMYIIAANETATLYRSYQGNYLTLIINKTMLSRG